MTAIDARSEAPKFVRAAKQWCRPLAALESTDSVGGKAHALGRLIRAGINVPDGFVLVADALQSQVAALGVDCAGTGAFDRMRIAELPADVREHLDMCMTQIFVDAIVVVRSSAIGEDGQADSFAGQLDSVLHVDRSTLHRAVSTVWASLWSERALFYRSARNVAERGMGVIIQRQVPAVCAGVLFTNTTTGEMLVEFAPGLGDALVQGEIDPSRIAIDRTTGVSRELATTSPFEISHEQREELVRIGHAVEKEFGNAQDVEWAMSADGVIHVVQSRPITAAVELPPRRRRIHWSNANVNENFPRPISPLLFSIASAGYTHYFRNLAVAFGVAPRRIRAMEPAFQQIIGVHGARMYYNLTSIHSVLRLAPFGQTLTKGFDAFVGADGADVRANAAGRQFAEVAIIAFKAIRLFLRLEKRVARFERTVDDFAARTTPERLASMSLAGLGAELAGFVEIRCHKWLDASLADAASMLTFSALERLLARLEVPMDRTILRAPNVVSGEPVFQLWDLSRVIRRQPALRDLFNVGTSKDVLDALHTDERFAEFRAAFDRYLTDWGFRCSEELMLTTPTFQERPAPLIDMLRSYARVDGESPRDTAQRANQIEAMLDHLNVPQRLIVRRLVRWTHASIRFRERARLKQALLYSRCRRIALAMGDALVRGGALEERDDVFFLTWTELTERAVNFRETTAARKTEQARASALTPPDSFTLDEDQVYEPTAASSHEDADAGPLTGTSACGGVVTGRAVVLNDVTESAQLIRGDVLVTKQTDPGWGPVFLMISGLVIERGGMLSHGAIIAREFGIPCVVGVKGAMRRIPSGAMITINGDRGSVHVHE